MCFSYHRCVRTAMIAAYQSTCQYCRGTFRDRELTIDHIVPLCCKGSDTLDNFLLACKDCNSRKGGKRLFKWEERTFLTKALEKASVIAAVLVRQWPERFFATEAAVVDRYGEHRLVWQGEAVVIWSSETALRLRDLEAGEALIRSGRFALLREERKPVFVQPLFSGELPRAAMVA